MGMQIDAATVESSVELLQKSPSDFTSENTPKENWNTNSKENMHPYVHCSIIYKNQDLKAAQVSTDECVKKLWCVYTIEYYSATAKQEIFPCSTAWTEQEN